LNMAEKSGFKVIRIFLWVDNETSYSRYLSRLGVVQTEENRAELEANFVKNVIDRDKQDFANVTNLNLGAISPDTGIIDSSHLSTGQITQTSFAFIIKNLQK
jgi:GMP synthase PP-ATPase subunit